MTELSPSLLELKAELGRAIRQDHHRRERRRKTIRTSAMIDLGGGSSAAPVSSFPVWDGATGTFVTATTGSSATSPYAYHITGGTTTTQCPFTNPARYETEPNDIYITSTQPLSAAELQQVLEMQTDHSAAAFPQLRADGVQSIGSFDNPIGAGCGYGAGATTATQPSPAP